jgi:AP-3 complex subunit mu
MHVDWASGERGEAGRQVSEESIKENFITVYQIMDEMMDNGFPMTTEPNVLKTMISPPTILGRVANSMGVSDKGSISGDLPEGMLSSIWWRRKGVKYTNNEVYLDIIEEIDCSIDTNGLMVTSDVSGEIMVNCKLSGMPDLTLSFTNPDTIDEVNFHPCVRLSRYERDKVLSFVPPDGKFKLASYSIDTSNGGITLPLYVKPQIHFSGSTGRVNIMVGPKSTLGGRTIEDVVITIPFTKNVATTNLSVNHGTAHFDDASKCLRWEIGKVPKERSPCLNGGVTLMPGTETPESGPTILVDFKIVMLSASGLKIDALTMSGEKYKPYKGVRFVTKAGRFQVRS